MSIKQIKKNFVSLFFINEYIVVCVCFKTKAVTPAEGALCQHWVRVRRAHSCEGCFGLHHRFQIHICFNEQFWQSNTVHRHGSMIRRSGITERPILRRLLKRLQRIQEVKKPAASRVFQKVCSEILFAFLKPEEESFLSESERSFSLYLSDAFKMFWNLLSLQLLANVIT